MICWMCHTRKKQVRRPVQNCRETGCIECGAELQIFVRTIQTVKFRRKQWANSVYEHEALVKTRTFERLCVNPECPKHWDPAKLPPDWLPALKPKVEEKKTFDDVVDALEQDIASL
jgi:hypothetical protein